MGRAYEVRKASIQKTGAAKAKLYSMYAREIYQAAKSGGTELESNAVLKRLVEKARESQVPNDIIKRAIDKVNSGVDESYMTVSYELFGPSGSTIIVECLTDNQNRTIADLRTCFNKSKAKLGVSGSVSFNYQHVGNIIVPFTDEEAMLDALIMADVDVKEVEIDGDYMQVLVEPSDLYKAKDAIDELIPGVEYNKIDLDMIPNEYTTLEGDDLMLFNRLITLLNDVDDVQNIYHNVENADN